MNKIILASKSPRRIELMKLIVSDFEIRPSNFNESQITESDPKTFVKELAFKKADSIISDKSDIVIGCDTVVVSEGKIFGKPKDKNEEINILEKLSNKTHSVITGVCILHDSQRSSFESTTNVTFYPLSKTEIINYANSNEPYDKAGGYGIQERGALFVKRINGDYYNIVGLPVAKLYHFLKPFLGEYETLR